MNIFGPLLGRNSQPSIFNAVKNHDQNRLLTDIQNNLNKEMKKLQTGSEESLKAKMGSVEFERARYQKFKQDLLDATDIIQNTVTRLDGMNSKLTHMLSEITKAETSDNDPDVDFQPELYARSFDAYYKGLKDLAENTRTQPNLLNSTGVALDYPLNHYGGNAKLYGAALTPSYKITDSGGLIWAPDATSNLLRQYDDYPASTTNKSGSFYDGLHLDSLDSSGNITFTTDIDSVSPESFSGTIQRDGVGLLNAWAYDNLSTDTGRQQATSDIYGAKDIVFVEKNRFQMMLTTLEFYHDSTKATLNGLNAELVEIQSKAAHELLDKQNEITQRYQVTQSSIAQSYIMRNQLSNLLPNSGLAGIFNLLV
ncbi:MAG: hypothetical protein ACNI26_14425 [Terasakiella sp.]|uniref:hypothetical protein n=1 Tax=unclassified Terasakiella TaxID=2614952 RepID=UPI003B0010E3